jgi:hypothetical protein
MLGAPNVRDRQQWLHRNPDDGREAPGNTIMGAVVSLDGYVADMGGGVGPPFDRYSIGDEESESTTARDREARRSAGQARALPPRYGAREPDHGPPRGRPTTETKTDQTDEKGIATMKLTTNTNESASRRRQPR